LTSGTVPLVDQQAETIAGLLPASLGGTGEFIFGIYLDIAEVRQGKDHSEKLK
jgi:hypothetical protein